MDSEDEYSNSGSNDSDFSDKQSSKKKASSGTKRSCMSLRSGRSISSCSNPKESYPKVVINHNDVVLPTLFLPPIDTVEVPDPPGTTDHNELASTANLSRDTAPTKGNLNLKITSTAVPEPKKNLPYLPTTIESLSKKNYLKSNGIADDPKFNWQKCFSHHSCYMLPSDFCKFITQFIIPSFRWIFFLLFCLANVIPMINFNYNDSYTVCTGFIIPQLMYP